MKNNDELLEQMIKEDFKRAAEEEDAALRDDDAISVPVGMKESLYLKISEEIERLEKSGKAADVKEIDNIVEIEKVRKKQREHLYANMSEDDRKALEIGRRVLEKERAQKEGKVVWKKKQIKKVYFGLAAALVLAMAVGVTIMGGPEKIIKMMTQMVGDREIEQVDSSEDNLIIVNEDEEDAYQKVSEEFGIEPVKIIIISDKMKFISMKYDDSMKTAELCYDYGGEKLLYLINSSYTKESFGFKIEDKVIDKYPIEVYGRKIEIKQYQVSDGEKDRFSASFEEMGLKYFLSGTMNKSEFDFIIENLYFLW
ncbi:hypothetical protein GN277_02135 [Lachnospiraceae bacterium WCA-9-b2]|uniref:DUF4367 domain-containing protein n=2 Tax=Sporofaciens musculi TaxID=2681861 RepID=A0A7X3SHD4_9FIRM|nr:hypothetical protein [Sporofaciens musculi]